MSEKERTIVIGMHICQFCGGPVASGEPCQNRNCPPSPDYAAIARTLLAENASLKAEVERWKAEWSDASKCIAELEKQLKTVKEERDDAVEALRDAQSAVRQHGVDPR